MTDPRTNPTNEPASDAGGASTADGAPTGGAAPESTQAPTFEQRMEDFGRRAEAAGQQLGREAQAAGERWSKDPSVHAAADGAARVWGLVVLAVGLWFFADVTLGIEMPAIAWRELWPVALILVGLIVVFRGMSRRRA